MRRVTDRAQSEREAHRSVDAAFAMVNHDTTVGGGIMAGALAYRLFIWMLPLALVAVAGLGLVSEAAEVKPEEAAQDLGLAGIVSSSVADAARSSSRWYALLIGIPVLLYATRSLLRTLIVVHRLVWLDIGAVARKPTIKATLLLLLTLVAFLAISTLTSTAQHSSVLAGTVALVLLCLPYGALWLLVSVRLPHGDAPWRWLIPGALEVGVGLQLLGAVTTYLISPNAESKQGTYGSIGVAAALLLGLFFISRVIVGSAVVNATLWERHKQKAAEVDGVGAAAIRRRSLIRPRDGRNAGLSFEVERQHRRHALQLLKLVP